MNNFVLGKYWVLNSRNILLELNFFLKKQSLLNNTVDFALMGHIGCVFFSPNNPK